VSLCLRDRGGVIQVVFNPELQPDAHSTADTFRLEYVIEVEGEVLESFRAGMYRIGLENGHETLAYTCGKMRRYRIRIAPGDKVKVELSPYDLNRGRITYRIR